MQAVGAYLRKLRRDKRYKQQYVAERIKELLGGESRRKTDVRTLGRWERGENTPLGDTLAAWCRVVDGDMRTIQDLLLDPAATQQHGVTLANKQIMESNAKKVERDDIAQVKESITQLLRRLDET